MKEFITTIAILLFCLSLKAQDTIYFPPTSGDQWDTLNITTLDWCPAKVDSLYNFLDSIDSKSFIVLKNGKIVLEKYFGTYTIDSTFSWYSAAKSLRAVLLGKAQEENYLNISDKTSDYLGTGWTSLTTSQEDSITIWNQLTMSSGLDETNFLCVNPSCLNYVSTAGTRWAYHNGPYSLTRNVLEAATGVNHNIYSNTLENLIGMNGTWLSFLGNSSYNSNARDMARFGLLVSNKGVWDNEPLLSDTSYLNQMLSPSQSLNPSYGYLWWLNGQDSYINTSSTNTIMGSIAPDAPMDVYAAAGSFGQFISISPANNLIMIRQGLSDNSDFTEFEMHNEIWKRILNLNCTTTAISTIPKEKQIEVYPNPSTHKVTIEWKTDKLRNVMIYNTLGKCVLKTSIGNSKTLDISNWEQGIYFLKVEDELTNHSVKIIKK